MPMNSLRGLHHISAQAIVPEHLLPYVAAVGASKPVLFGAYVGHVHEDAVVLVGYPLGKGVDGTETGEDAETPVDAIREGSSPACAAVDAAVDSVLHSGNYARITVLAPVRPTAAPVDSVSVHDVYWAVPLPPAPPRQKLRNMLHRARRDVRMDMAPRWTVQHDAMVLQYCRTRQFEAGTRHIFQHLGDYVRRATGSTGYGGSAPVETKGKDAPPSFAEVQVFSAYARADDTLLACAIGDYSSLHTAFYMFAFRHPHAPPGTSDLLLEALCAEGLARGHCRVNLGLGINAGISFFKQKWQAQAFLPYVETTWDIHKPHTSWLSRLLGT